MTENSLSDDGAHMSEEEKITAQAYILKNKLEAAKRGGNRAALRLPEQAAPAAVAA